VAAEAGVRVALIAACAVSLLLSAPAARAVPDDDYLAGYATAVIERDLGLEVMSVEVHQGVARVVVKDLEGHPEERITAALERIEGIVRVEVVEASSESESPPAPPPPAAPETGGLSEEEKAGFQLLPRVELFDPLIADPRQPHFSASYNWYLDDPDLGHVGSATFGETFALLGGAVGGGRWELGFLGGVFSIFDLDAPSYDLLNTDFWAGPTLSLRKNRLSGTLRLYHQSSHLGDEFLLRHPGIHRENLSYEGLDLLVSRNFWSWLRLYGGGGVLLHTEPDLQRLSAQGGAELRSPLAFFGDAVRPIAAFDYASREENHWREELSGAAGIQLENPDISKLRVQVLATYYKGNSRNGQFFLERIETIGIGVHFHY
jgi:hypothetical protein